MGWAEVGGHNMIYMTIRELHYTFADFFIKLEFSHDINFSERNREAAMGRVRSGDIIFFRVPRSSLRVRRSSVGCSVVRKGTA
jgi:hypothetical protein